MNWGFEANRLESGIKGVFPPVPDTPKLHRPATPVGELRAFDGCYFLREIPKIGACTGNSLRAADTFEVLPPERRKMAENKNSSRIGVYIGNELLSRCDAAIPKTNASSRSEFICDALEHYLAVLNARDNSKVLTPALESVIGGKIAGTEERLSRIIFKLAVELAMLNNIFAATYEIDPADLSNLRDMCVDEVARIGGRYRLEEAIEFQNG